MSFDQIEEGTGLHQGFSILIQATDLLEAMVIEILSLVPDRLAWRLTLTADVAATVNAIDERAAEEGYSTDRGSGHVGGVTLPASDGTYDIVIGIPALLDPPAAFESGEELLALSMATGRHLARHEAGHVALGLRGEADRSYQELSDLDPTSAMCRSFVARYMDDFRIERHLREHARPVYTHEESLGSEIEHLVSELNASKSLLPNGLDEAARRSDIAVSGFVRAIAYLSAELGLDEAGDPVLPEQLPQNWVYYLGTAWPMWSSTFHKLKPADQPMDLDELTSVHAELCELASNWSRAIGYDRGVDHLDRAFAFWTKEVF